MRVSAFVQNKKNLIVLEFNRELPLFPEFNNPSCFQRRNPIFDRGNDVESYAHAMVVENRGALALEHSTPAYDVYYEFVNDLVCARGFVAILCANRYAMNLAVGRLFDHRTIAHRIATLVHQHFYPNETLELEISTTIASQKTS